MKKLIALSLVFVLLLSVTACKQEEKKVEKKPQDNTSSATEIAPIVGAWRGKIDMTGFMGVLLSEAYGVPFQFEDLSYSVIFKFYEDGTYESVVDEEEGDKIVNNLIDGIVDSLIAAGATESEEEIREKINSQMDIDALAESFVSDYKEGYYVYEDGLIYMAQKDMKGNYKEKAETVWQIVLDGSTMTVEDMLDVEGNSSKEESYGLLPIVLQKLKE